MSGAVLSLSRLEPGVGRYFAARPALPAAGLAGAFAGAAFAAPASGAGAAGDPAGDLRQDVVLGEDEDLLTVDLHLAAAVLRVDDLVALHDVQRDPLAVLVAALTDGEHPAALRLLLGGVGQHDAARADLFLLHGLDDHAIAQRRQVHRLLLGSSLA